MGNPTTDYHRPHATSHHLLERAIRDQLRRSEADPESQIMMVMMMMMMKQYNLANRCIVVALECEVGTVQRGGINPCCFDFDCFILAAV